MSVFRNLGTVNKWGIDGSVAYEPIKRGYALCFRFVEQVARSRTTSRSAVCPTGVTCDNIDPAPAPWRSGAAHSRQAIANPERRSIRTASRRSDDLGPLDARRRPPSGLVRVSSSITIRRCSVATSIVRHSRSRLSRHDSGSGASDGLRSNGTGLLAGQPRCAGEARAFRPALKQTYLQLNVYNLFDKFYVGGFGGGLSQSISCASVAVGGCPNLRARKWRVGQPAVRPDRRPADGFGVDQRAVLNEGRADGRPRRGAGRCTARSRRRLHSRKRRLCFAP